MIYRKGGGNQKTENSELKWNKEKGKECEEKKRGMEEEIRNFSYNIKKNIQIKIKVGIKKNK